MSAVLSDCGTYRYALWRDIPQSLLATRLHATCLFVMLNPSTADAEHDDPTIRRCIGFARDWGFGRLAVANVYALRATDPRELRKHPHPIGPDNDHWLAELADQASLVIAAWGTRAPHPARVADVTYILEQASQLHCLGRTSAGYPKHPLYVPAGTAHRPFFRRLAA